MNKRIYVKPAFEAIEIQTAQILCDSGKAPKRWGGEFGQVPGLNPADDRLA